MKLIASNQLTLTNILERAEIRRETFYKLTNSADVPEAPSGNRNLILYSADPWRAPSDYYQFNGVTKTDETLNGSVVYKTRSIWSRLGMNFGKQLIDRSDVKVGDEFTYSVYVRTNQETPIKARLFFRYSGQSNAEDMTGEKLITQEWQRFTKTFTVTQKMLSGSSKLSWVGFEQTSDCEDGKYVYYSCNKLERGSVATPHSPAPEDLGWSTDTLVPTQQQRYLWKFEYIYYSDGSVEVTKPVNLSIAGADADTTGVTDAINKNNQAVAEAKQQLTAVANDLSKAKTDLQNAVSAVDTKATNLKNDLTQAKQDLASQAQQLREQAGAQSELTNRVSSVEKTANGTKTTVSELSKTVAQNGKDITSVTNRTKTVEDDLANTKTTLTQVQTTANSASQKTATLETGLNGLSARFDSLKIGAVNLLHNSKGPFQPKRGTIDNLAVYPDAWINMEEGKEYTLSAKGSAPFTSIHSIDEERDKICLWLRSDSGVYRIISSPTTGTDGTKFTWNDPTGRYYLRVNTYKADNSNYAEEVQIEEGNMRSTYSQNESDFEQKVAEYKQTADQNYASLSSTVQNLDGTVQHNKTVAEQTAEGFKTRIESLETYKNGESERANAYFESAKTETAKQLTAERTAIANNYVAKSTYTSDVTGIRNELSATTSTANATKTNLANYQASNDKVVASLKSSLQTTDGNVSNLQTKVEAVPGQITSAVSAVEGKIPTSAGGRNLALGTSGDWNSGWTSFNGQNNQINIIYRIFNRGLKIGDKVNIRLVLKYSDIVAADGQTARISPQSTGNVSGWGAGRIDVGQDIVLSSQSDEIVLTASSIITEKHLRNEYWEWRLRVDYVKSGKIQWKEAKAEVGDLPTPWSPAPEDTAEQISNLSSEIKQTADGITLLATKTELNSAKNELQSGITTATNKANNAQAAANNNAQTISTHTTQISALNTGLQAKVSQTDFNTLSGRVTTAENNITAKANELSSKITSVEGKIPTSIGGRNLYALSKNAGIYTKDITDFVQNVETGEISFKVTGRDPFFGTTVRESRGVKIPVKVGQDIAVQLTNKLFIKNFVSYFGEDNNAVKDFKNYQTNKFVIPASELEGVSYVTFRFGLVENTQEIGSVHKTKIKVEYGNVYTDWSPAPEDTASQISSLSSEFKQTTDAIKASVSSLDKSTVKSSSLTINADGIVMKAGKSTTDVANAIGSYFSVNQNAINLFADKIKVKGNMIVNGTITGDKIKASSVDVSKIVGIDANFIKSKIEYAMIDWLKGKTITAYNDNMTIDLQDGRISFKDGSNAVYRQTPDGIHTGFLHFEAGSLGGIYAAFGATSTRQGINSKSSEFAGIRCYRVSKNGDSHDAKIDKIEVIGDTVQFGHGYRSDGSIGGGFIMDTAAFGNETPYSFNRVIKSIESLWRILHDHAKNTGYRFNDSAFINALNNEYNAWHDMHND